MLTLNQVIRYPEVPEWGTKNYLIRGNGKKTIYANNTNAAAHLALELSETAQLAPELRDL